jgi:hypothetical protein
MAAQRNDDEIAAALQGLNAGHHDSTAEHAGSVHGEDVQLSPVTPPPPKPSPSAPRPSSESPSAKRPSTPAARPAQPRVSPQSMVARPPSASSPPPGPRSRPATPARPAAPGQPTSAGFDQEVFDDGDETVLEGMSATPLDYRGPKPAPPPRPRKTPVFKTLGFRRTVIPVLLTTGLMMLAMFAARWFVDEEAPLALLPAWTGILLLLTGVLLVALAVANMMLVRAELAKRPTTVAR